MIADPSRTGGIRPMGFDGLLGRGVSRCKGQPSHTAPIFGGGAQNPLFDERGTRRALVAT